MPLYIMFISRTPNNVHTAPPLPPDIAVHSQINALLGEYFEQVQYGMVDDLTAHAQAFINEANDIIAKSLAN